MKVRAVRLHGKNDLRLDTYTLPAPGPGEILAEVITDSLCMSTYKAMVQGSAHRCIPNDIAEHPVVLGHELCGRILETGEGVDVSYEPGMRFAVQAKMVIDGQIKSPGYSYSCYGGSATAVLIPAEVVGGGYVLPYAGAACYQASLAEPVSCILSALRSSYHCVPDTKHHVMGLREGGSLAILAGCGPMGLAAAETAMAVTPRPRRIALTDVNVDRVRRARQLLRPKNGVQLEFYDTDGTADIAAVLGADVRPFDDVLIMAPVREVIEQASRIVGPDGCINFFAGPASRELPAELNFYDIHYNLVHVVGTSGSDVHDMRDALRYIETGAVDVSFLVSHIGGLDCAAQATRDLPSIPGGKKLVYCGIDLPLTALDDLESLAAGNPFLAGLHRICQAHGGQWSPEAETYVLTRGQAESRGCVPPDA